MNARSPAVILSVVLMLPALASATGKPEEPKKETPTQVQDQAQIQAQKATARAAAKSASASNAKAKAKAKATGGKAAARATSDQSVEIVDESTSDDHSVTRYEAEKQAAASAAALEAAYCSGGGMSAQSRGFGFALTGRSSFCELLELAKLHLEIAESHFAAAEALRAATSKGPAGGGTLAQDAVVRGRAEVAQAEAIVAGLTLRANESNTGLRRFFSKWMGSLPILCYLAPRD